MKAETHETVYKISLEDLQVVAREVLERELTTDELTAVGNSVGNYIDWFQAIENAINEHIRWHCRPAAAWKTRVAEQGDFLKLCGQEFYAIHGPVYRRFLHAGWCDCLGESSETKLR